MKINEFLNNVTSKNYKAYLLFLILTLFLWFAIQMTKTYNYNNDLSIQLSNIPKHIVLDSSRQSLALNIKSNGFKLWKYGMSPKELIIDFSEFEKDTNRLTIGANKVKNIIEKKYEFDVENITLDELLFSFGYKIKETKMVPLKPRLKYEFASGYNTIDTLKLIPDSVTISGSASDINKISSVSTDKLEIKDVSDTLSGKVGLMKPDKNIQTSLENVDYYLPVEKFSENTLMIDIEILNTPDSLELNIFPNKAKVSFLVALKSFGKVSKLDFKVVCDFKERYQEDAIMIPKLIEYPDNILNPKLHIRKVDYLTKQLP